MIDRRLKTIANHYGWGRQLDKTIEELAELQVALMKYRHQAATLDDVADEIADCLILLQQNLYLYNIENNVEHRIDFKIERQLKRIEEERRDR